MLDLRDPSLLRHDALIDGRWTPARNGARFAVINPATGDEITHVASLGPDEVEAAIEISAQAQRAWAKRTAKDRATILRRWFDLVIENTDDLARIMTCEQGKPLAEAVGEISYSASFIEWFAEEGKRVYGETIPSPTQGNRLTVIRQPVGVVAAITPWNFPAAMITRKAAPALAAGCSMIVRPADLTPLTALALGELAQRAGLPAGVLQIVTGPAQPIGSVLTASPVVRKLSFTGSTEVGRLLMAQCAPTIKRLSLELGGNAPFIVFDDADLDAAVDGALASKFRNGGQTCVCANRIYVQRGVAKPFTKKLVEKVAALKIGPGTDADVQIGPMIEEKAITKFQAHISDATARGAQLLHGGDRREGLFVTPAVISGVTEDMAVAREETFAPLAPLFIFDTEEEVIARANDTIFGLAAYFYSEGVRRSTRVAEALEYGIVGHNTGMISNEVAPFGGIKQSGLGREGSRHGLEEYLEMKYIASSVV
ncbi:NAD-dependent succinate-semialdehyde dehydrogenase [Roseibacterium beibuensis]|nr:NAD-dependent succinate-semialdehyde dehydrogenase [Roseibacterium beibuensis]MCS6623934.1 NAD-dependent succinate-semialdehyde dehydrogenase [Roseibacterium beibuensis]